MNDTVQGSHLAPSDVLRGQRVYLRLPRFDELSFIRMLRGDRETMASVGGPMDFPEPKAREWFARMVEPGGPGDCYCLVCAQDDVPIGEISFHQWDPEERSATLNVKVLAARRGHGYAKDAVLTLLALFFGRVGGRVMTDDVAVGNQAAQHLLCSLGFDTDHSVWGVCRMVMTEPMYAARYGKANKQLTL